MVVFLGALPAEDGFVVYLDELPLRAVAEMSKEAAKAKKDLLKGMNFNVKSKQQTKSAGHFLNVILQTAASSFMKFMIYFLDLQKTLVEGVLNIRGVFWNIPVHPANFYTQSNCPELAAHHQELPVFL